MRKYLALLGLSILAGASQTNAQCSVNSSYFELRMVNALSPTTDYIVQVRHVSNTTPGFPDCGSDPTCISSGATSTTPVSANINNGFVFGLKWDATTPTSFQPTVGTLGTGSGAPTLASVGGAFGPFALGSATKWASTNDPGFEYQDFSDNGAVSGTASMGNWVDDTWYDMVRITSAVPLAAGTYPLIVAATDLETSDAVHGNGVCPWIAQDFNDFAFKATNVLSVDLKSFTGVKEGSTSLLKWITSTEEELSHFVIERSNTGLFDASPYTVGEVKSKSTNGNSNVELSYDLIDKAPKAGHNYYRLKSVNKNGKFEYSHIVDIYFNEGSSVSVYPNPATDNINIEIDALSSTQASVKIVDVTGKIVKAIDYKLVKGNNVNPISLEGVANGTYFVNITDGKSINFSQQIQKM